MKDHRIIFLVGVLSVSLVGCGVPKETHNAVVAERDKLVKEVTSLKDNVAKIEKAKTISESSVTELQANVSRMSQEKDKIQADYNALQAKISELEAAKASLTDELAKAKAKPTPPYPELVKTPSSAATQNQQPKV